MSEVAESARKAMRAKAERMVHTDPHQKVDASGWTPPEPLNTEAKTGLRPISARQYKRGGKVEGDHAKHHAGHKPRKSGGRAFADAMVNRDVREANEERDGTKHVGGFRRGGRAEKFGGGLLGNAGTGMAPPSASSGITGYGGAAPSAAMSPMQGYSGAGPMQRQFGMNTGFRKDGGKVSGHEAHTERHDESCRCHKCVGAEAKGGEVERHHESCACHKCRGGSVSDGELEGTRPTGGREARKAGGRADAHWIEHADLKKGALHRELHVPESERIPEGKLNKAEHSPNKLVAKRAELAKTLRREAHASGGKAGKDKMNVNIVISPGHPQAPMGAMPPPRPPMPPPGLPAGAPGVPPGMPPPPMGAGMPPGGPPPMMPRKSGGRAGVEHVAHEMAEAGGAGGGKGRLEKITAYGRGA